MTARATARPVPLAPRPYHFPRFERRALRNGLQLVIAPVRKLPMVSVTALIEAGAACDERDREGVARLTADLLLEGTRRFGGAELTERFERLGASVVATTDWDGVEVTLTALTNQIAPAIALLAEVLRSPSFPEREVERLKAERQAELLQLRTEPRGLADEMFARALYEDGSRYSRPLGGTEATVAAITREDVQRFYGRWYHPASVTLIVAGDVDADTAERMASDSFSDWAGGAPGPVQASDRPARSTRAVHLVAKEDAPQSELRIGNVGLPRRHPDYFPAVVMNAVLGGLFSSRINLNLREQHGYTYGAFSMFDWRRQAGPFVVSTAVQSDVTAAAVTEVLAEIARIRESEVTDSELSLATSYLDGVFPIRYETTEAIAGALATLVSFGLPDDYFDTYRDRIRGVSTADILRVARAHLQPDALQVLVVGDVETIHAPLAALALGPVHLTTP